MDTFFVELAHPVISTVSKSRSKLRRERNFEWNLENNTHIGKCNVNLNFWIMKISNTFGIKESEILLDIDSRNVWISLIGQNGCVIDFNASSISTIN